MKAALVVKGDSDVRLFSDFWDLLSLVWKAFFFSKHHADIFDLHEFDRFK